MTMITKNLLKTLRPDIDAALQEVGRKHGVQLTATSGSYGGNSGTFKLEILPVATDGSVICPKAIAFTDHASDFGLNPEWLGQTIIARGKIFTITGLNLNRPKYRVAITDQDGKEYGMPADAIIRKMAGK
jgi:hypothetical protein